MYQIIKIETGANWTDAKVYDVCLADNFDDARRWAYQRSSNDAHYTYYVVNKTTGHVEYYI